MAELARESSAARTVVGISCIAAAVAALTFPIFALTGLLFASVVLAVLLAPRQALPLMFMLLVVQEAVARNVEAIDPALPTLVRSVDEILLVATVLRVGLLMLRRDTRWFRLREWRWPMLFLAAGGLSSLLHWRGLAIAGLGMALASKFFIFLLLALTVEWKRGDAQRALRWSIPLTGLLLLTGIVGFVWPGLYERYFASLEGDVSYERGGLNPFALPFVNPGLYGWLMAVLLLAATTLSIEKRRRGSWLAIAAAAIGVLASLRRRPLLGIPMAIGSALAQLSRRQIVAILTVAGLAVAIVGYYARDIVDIVIQDTIASYLDPLSRDRTARAALTAGGVAVAAQHLPLGAGFGSYGGYVSQRNYSPLYDELGLSTIYGLAPESPYYIQDTYWPHLLGETGVLGAAAMLVFLASTWRRLMAIRKRSRSDETRLIALFAAMILVEGLVESIAGPVFEYSLQAFVLAIPIGMALRLASEERPDDATPASVVG